MKEKVGYNISPLYTVNKVHKVAENLNSHVAQGKAKHITADTSHHLHS